MEHIEILVKSDKGEPLYERKISVISMTPEDLMAESMLWTTEIMELVAAIKFAHKTGIPLKKVRSRLKKQLDELSPLNKSNPSRNKNYDKNKS